MVSTRGNQFNWAELWATRVFPYIKEAISMDYDLGDFWDIFTDEWVDRLSNPKLMRDFRNNGLACGVEIGQRMNKRLQGDTQAPDRREMVSRFNELCAIAGKEFVVNMVDGEVGKPLTVDYKGLKLNRDELFHTYHTWQLIHMSKLCGITPSRVLEIGCGYGSLATRVKQLYPSITYYSVDLPWTQALQAYYLSRRHPGASMCFVSPGDAVPEGGYDFVFIPHTHPCIQGDGLPVIDLAITCRAFQEMKSCVIQDYVSMVERVCEGALYLVNAYRKDASGEPILFKHTPLDDRWHVKMSQPVWIQGHLHEAYLLRSTNSVSPTATELFSTLPGGGITPTK